MMSMTGFGQGTGQANGYGFTAVVRTVNHRFLDVKVSLPFGLQALEGRVVGAVRKSLNRGRVEVTVAVAPDSPPVVRPRVDASFASAWVSALNQLAAELKIPGTLVAGDLLRLQGVMFTAEPVVEMDALAPGVEAALEAALAGVTRMRRLEGEVLAADLAERLGTMGRLCDALERQAPATVQATQRRVEQRLAELLRGAPVDSARVATECAILADRLDVTEEITRLRCHVAQFRKLVAAGEPVGRKLDFLCQELNREANTLTNKAGSAEVSADVVDLKAEIERVREQVQNVE
jgi:uncharacterized protein (TIGR00255 family)